MACRIQISGLKISLILAVLLVCPGLGLSYTYRLDKRPLPHYKVAPLWTLQMKRDRFFKFHKAEQGGLILNGSQLLVPNDSGFLYALTKETGDVQWIFKAEGRFHAAPLLEGGLLYIGDSKGVLYALNLTGGQELWRARIGGEIVTRPAISGDRIFVGDAASRLVALKKSDGAFLWQGVVSRPPGGIIYYSGTPTLAHGGGLIGASVDGHFFRSPLAGGMPDWLKSPPAKRGVVTEGVWDLLSYGDDVIVGSSGGAVCRVDGQSGNERWCSQAGDGVQLNMVNDTIVTGNFSGDVQMIDAVSGAPLWVAHGLEGPLTAPAVGKDFVAVGGPKVGLFLVNPESSSLGLRRPCKGGVAAAPAAEGDRVYFVSGMGRVTALKVTKLVKKTRVFEKRRSRLKST